MEYFKSSLKSVLGSTVDSAVHHHLSDPETIERLLDRVATSTLLEDRRDACRALKSLSKKYRLEVGARGIDSLLQVLELDTSDAEIISYCLEVLCNLTAIGAFEEELAYTSDISERFTEILCKTRRNVETILTYLDRFDFHVRWSCIRLLTNLLGNRPKDIQDVVLVSPMTVSKLMDLLLDCREVIRNDALLLLINLTKSNSNLQKIVVFENAFDRLFDVIRAEGSIEGGIVVQDCLVLMLNLLRNNTSNISFFKEGSYIQQLTPMLLLAAAGGEASAPEDEASPVVDIEWSPPQKLININYVLQIVRTLVSPNNPVASIGACQKAMRQTDLLELLARKLLMANGVPIEILVEIIHTIAEVIRGNLVNQEYLAATMAPSTPPKSALVILLKSMNSEKQTFRLRCACLYCLQCFLHRNEIGQANLLRDLTGLEALAPGQLLVAGLHSSSANDTLNHWFSAVALSHCLISNGPEKENFLSVTDTVVAASSPTALTLFQFCAMFLQKPMKNQSKIGVLMLLATWMAYCPKAVQHFLQINDAMVFLIAQASANDSDNIHEEMLQLLCTFLMGICLVFNANTVDNYTKDKLMQIVEKRVGLETFCKKLSEISRHEVYAKAAKQPQLDYKESVDLLLDYEFCQLYRNLEANIVKTLGIQKDLCNGFSELTLNECENALLLQYKDLIREQDKKVQDLESSFKCIQCENNQLKVQIGQIQQSYAELNDQNTVMRLQLQGAGGSSNNIENNPSKMSHEIVQQQLQMELNSKQRELDQLRKDQDDLLELLTDQETKLNYFRNRLRELDPDFNEDSSDMDD